MGNERLKVYIGAVIRCSYRLKERMVWAVQRTKYMRPESEALSADFAEAPDACLLIHPIRHQP